MSTEAIYLELATVRESATIPCLWQRLEPGRGLAKPQCGKEGRLQVNP